jgi:hypothetical protein
MNDKLVVIIASSEAGKACAGMMYAVNALKYLWMEDVRLFFFGPAQELLLQDAELRRLLHEYLENDGQPVACKFIADRDAIAAPIAALGVQVEYVGAMISELIQQGYIPMVW